MRSYIVYYRAEEVEAETLNEAAKKAAELPREIESIFIQPTQQS